MSDYLLVREYCALLERPHKMGLVAILVIEGKFSTLIYDPVDIASTLFSRQKNEVNEHSLVITSLWNLFMGCPLIQLNLRALITTNVDDHTHHYTNKAALGR